MLGQQGGDSTWREKGVPRGTERAGPVLHPPARQKHPEPPGSWETTLLKRRPLPATSPQFPALSPQPQVPGKHLTSHRQKQGLVTVGAAMLEASQSSLTWMKKNKTLTEKRSPAGEKKFCRVETVDFVARYIHVPTSALRQPVANLANHRAKGFEQYVI